jgi:hypothetical protein
VAGTPYDPAQNDDKNNSGVSELVSTSKLAGFTDACVQTTDTAFALCAQCTEIQFTLVDSAQLVSRLCDRNMIESRFSCYDWNTLLNVGRLDIGSWFEALQTDSAALDERCCVLMRSVENLNLERDKLEESSQIFINRIQALEKELNSLKVCSETK